MNTRCVRCRSVTYGHTYYIYKSLGDLPDLWDRNPSACCRALYDPGASSGQLPVDRKYLTDLCASVAQHVISNAADLIHGGEEAEILSGFMHSELEYWTDHVENVVPFLRRARFNPDRPSWYSMELERVSFDSDKQYDTRWRQITPGMDGSVASILRIVTEDSRGCLLEELAAAIAIRDAVVRTENTVLDNPCDVCGVADWRDWDTLQAVRALAAAMSLLRSADVARGLVDCWLMNTKRQRSSDSEVK